MKNFKGFIILLIVIAIIWFFRPFFHPLVMLFVISPLKLILAILIIFGVYSLFKKMGRLHLVPKGHGNFSVASENKLPVASLLAYSIVLIVLLFGIGLESEIRFFLTSRQISYDSRADLPVFNQIRLIPKQVATRYAEDTFQSPQEHLGDSQIVIADGKLERVFPRLPDGGLLYLLNKMSGFVTVEVDLLDRKVNIADQKFNYSEGIGITDNVYFQLNKKKYFVEYSSEPIYLKNDKGEWVTVVPYIGYHGFPFRVPYWAGVSIVKSDGSIEDYTPEQAQEISYIKGNRIYPKELSTYYAESYSYNGGLINKWFLHKNQVEVVSLPGDEPIIHASTAEGFKQVIVGEPYGRSYGIYKIFIFDATSGKREVINFDQNSQLTGPVAAADYIKKSFPTYNWNSFTLAEPRPVRINNDLNWLLSIIPNDSAGIATTVLLDAKTNKVTEVKSLDQLNALIAGNVVPESSTPAGQAQDSKAEINAKIDSIQKELNDLKSLISTQ